MIVEPTSPNYYKDETGVWWYDPPGKTRRSRCKIKKCEQCCNDFIISTYSYASSRYCTRACSGLARRGTREHERGDRSHRWKGGRIIHKGYVLVYAPDHHSIAGRGTQRKYVFEHRLVMEEHIGRPLRPEETVHHGPGGTMDNRIENLELWSKAHPAGQRVSDLVTFAREILERYGELVPA